MPPSHLKVTLKPGEPLKGTSKNNGHVLFGYKDSWACEIRNTVVLRIWVWFRYNGIGVRYDVENGLVHELYKEDEGGLLMLPMG
ncbi:hypothetical protein C5167_012514 [Papaver somniferum]|uniref:Uncharacterized protein n=1 Tax=Papaver somniferum TaxID=3469 RepID=A0A4Y7J1Y3_PAPSO|nr:hypothetical protein C5167_012514 [Papaver somniferum]